MKKYKCEKMSKAGLRYFADELIYINEAFTKIPSYYKRPVPETILDENFWKTYEYKFSDDDDTKAKRAAFDKNLEAKKEAERKYNERMSQVKALLGDVAYSF